MPSKNTVKKPYVVPVLLIIAVIMLLAMVRLGIWQLNRADEKQAIVDLSAARAMSAPMSVGELIRSTERPNWLKELRFQPVQSRGRFVAEGSILIENQVLNNQAGYQLITPFQEKGTDHLILVSRGWLPAGPTRQDLPEFSSPKGIVTIEGRLNRPFAQPPLWDDGFPVNEGMVWQYLPIDVYAKQIQASVLPLMLELAPESQGTLIGESVGLNSSDNENSPKRLKVAWQQIGGEQVNKHKAYAFQWFSMAVAFFIACLVLLLRNLAVKQKP